MYQNSIYVSWYVEYIRCMV